MEQTRFNRSRISRSKKRIWVFVFPILIFLLLQLDTSSVPEMRPAGRVSSLSFNIGIASTLMLLVAVRMRVMATEPSEVCLIVLNVLYVWNGFFVLAAGALRWNLLDGYFVDESAGAIFLMGINEGWIFSALMAFPLIVPVDNVAESMGIYLNTGLGLIVTWCTGMVQWGVLALVGSYAWKAMRPSR